MEKIDWSFNETYFKEVLPLISKSFLHLSSELCECRLNGFDAGSELEDIMKEKANQVKKKINSFIDLQVEQNIKVFKD